MSWSSDPFVNDSTTLAKPFFRHSCDQLKADRKFVSDGPISGSTRLTLTPHTARRLPDSPQQGGAEMIGSPKIVRAGKLIAEAQRELDIVENLVVEITSGIESAATESLILALARAMESIGKAVRVLDSDERI